jgi:hypothetical protein
LWSQLAAKADFVFVMKMQLRHKLVKDWRFTIAAENRLQKQSGVQELSWRQNASSIKA